MVDTNLSLFVFDTDDSEDSAGRPLRHPEVSEVRPHVIQGGVSFPALYIQDPPQDFLYRSFPLYTLQLTALERGVGGGGYRVVL